MEEGHRQLLRRRRVELVTELQPELLLDPLLAKGIFSQDMLEEIQKSGTRRDQARQLVIDLQTRGRRAFPAFLESLEETGQHELVKLLQEGLTKHPGRPKTSWPEYTPVRPPAPVQCSDTDLNICRKPKPGRNWNDEMIYKMDVVPRGYCLIINNVDFSKSSRLGRREGSDIDRDNVKRLFKKLQFEVIAKQNLTKQELEKELRELAHKDHTRFDCCVVVLLSHGNEAQHSQFPGAIYGVDGNPISVQQIVRHFDGSNCPTLRKKPKLFFIQACGGGMKDLGFKTADEIDGAPGLLSSGESLQMDAVPCQTLDEIDATSSLPTPSDILVSYSTFPGYVSWRDKNEGSWYMKTLVEVFSEYAHLEDLQRLLTMVTKRISEDEEAKGIYKQIPGSFNFLRKQLYFIKPLDQ
uniref:Caspase 9, apoptosis-related cysteine protease n=1 Tax=Callorhinchus milii TaxID=7868 RepID=V9KNT3_CALMI